MVQSERRAVWQSLSGGHLTAVRWLPKGPVIKYKEGGYKKGKSQVPIFLTPPPPFFFFSLFSPLVPFCTSPFSMAKLPSSRVKTTQNLLCPPPPPRVKLCQPPSPVFVGVKLHLPPPLLLCSSPPPTSPVYEWPAPDIAHSDFPSPALCVWGARAGNSRGFILSLYDICHRPDCSCLAERALQTKLVEFLFLQHACFYKLYHYILPRKSHKCYGVCIAVRSASGIRNKKIWVKYRPEQYWHLVNDVTQFNHIMCH